MLPRTGIYQRVNPGKWNNAAETSTRLWVNCGRYPVYHGYVNSSMHAGPKQIDSIRTFHSVGLLLDQRKRETEKDGGRERGKERAKIHYGRSWCCKFIREHF